MIMRFVFSIMIMFGGTLNICAQSDTVTTNITFRDGRVVEYRALDKPFDRKISIVLNGKVERISLKNINGFTSGDISYVVWNPPGFIGARPYQVVESGSIELLRYKQYFLVRLAEYDYMEGINQKAPYRTLALYLDDHPDLSLNHFQLDSLTQVINQYNEFKTSTNSLSTMESRINEYKRFVFKAMVFLPGIGYEIGITKSLTFTQTAGITTIGYGNGNFVLETGTQGMFRLYHNLSRKESLYKPTQWRSGNYFALGTALYTDLSSNLKQYVFIDYGRQNIFRNYYTDYSVGIGFDPINQNIGIRLAVIGGFAF